MRTSLVAVALSAILAGTAIVPQVTASDSAAQRAAPSCEGKTATLFGTRGDDTLRGTDGDDVIVAFAGKDTIQSRGGDDIVCSGPGHDRVRTQRGSDQVWLGNDRDFGDGGRGSDFLRGQDQSDLIAGEEGKDDVCAGGRPRNERQLTRADVAESKSCETIRSAISADRIT